MAEKAPTTAQLKKFRRKLNRTIKQGAKGLGQSAMALQQKNLKRNELVQGLNNILDTGTVAEQVGARKAKKRLSVDWQNRNTGSLTGFWDQSQVKVN